MDLNWIITLATDLVKNDLPILLIGFFVGYGILMFRVELSKFK